MKEDIESQDCDGHGTHNFRMTMVMDGGEAYVKELVYQVEAFRDWLNDIRSWTKSGKQSIFVVSHAKTQRCQKLEKGWCRFEEGQVFN